MNKTTAFSNWKIILEKVKVGSCDCGTKTPEAKYHSPTCTYRDLCELEGIILTLAEKRDNEQVIELQRKLDFKIEEARKMTAEHMYLRNLYTRTCDALEMTTDIFTHQGPELAHAMRTQLEQYILIAQGVQPEAVKPQPISKWKGFIRNWRKSVYVWNG